MLSIDSNMRTNTSNGHIEVLGEFDQEDEPVQSTQTSSFTTFDSFDKQQLKQKFFELQTP